MGQDAYRGIAKNAVIIVLDGLRIEESFGDDETFGEGWSDAYDGATGDLLPLVRANLLPRGGLAKPGYVTGVTLTAPAHADLLLGARRPHGQFPMQEEPGLYRTDLPNLFEMARDQLDLEADQAVFSTNGVLLDRLTWSVYPGLGEERGALLSFVSSESDATSSAHTDGPVIDDVRDRLEAGARLVVANLHAMDRAGHDNPEIYHQYVTDMDDDVHAFWTQFIQGQGSEWKDETVVAVISDHGRHRYADGDTPWQHHGCSCRGCREVPMLLLGPGIARGSVSAGAHVLEDITATIAWLMGVDMPHGEGMVMTDLLQDPSEAAQPTGPTQLHCSARLLAHQAWTGDFDARSEIFVDGRTTSDGMALHLEAPRVLQTSRADYLAARRLVLSPGFEYWFWEPMFMAREVDESWRELPALVSQVWPHFSPALAADPNSVLYAAYSSNENGSAERDSPIALVRYDPNAGWQGQDATSVEDVYLPTRPSLTVDEDGAWVAYGASDSLAWGAHNRHIDVYRVEWPIDGDQTWTHSYRSPDQDAAGRYLVRLENPTLFEQDGVLYLAFHGYGEEGNFVVATSLDGPEGSWTSTRTLDSSGNVLTHIPPSWSPAGMLQWARLGDDDLVEACRASYDDLSNADCVSLERAYIDSLASCIDRTMVSVSDGAAQWEEAEVPGW